jgi:hypothetical protein
MTLGYSRRTSTILIIAIIALQLVLISDNLKPVKGDKKLLKKLKKIGAVLFLLKSKSKTNFSMYFPKSNFLLFDVFLKNSFFKTFFS